MRGGLPVVANAIRVRQTWTEKRKRVGMAVRCSCWPGTDESFKSLTGTSTILVNGSSKWVGRCPPCVAVRHDAKPHEKQCERRTERPHSRGRDHRVRNELGRQRTRHPAH